MQMELWHPGVIYLPGIHNEQLVDVEVHSKQGEVQATLK